MVACVLCWKARLSGRKLLENAPSHVGATKVAFFLPKLGSLERLAFKTDPLLSLSVMPYRFPDHILHIMLAFLNINRDLLSGASYGRSLIPEAYI